MRLSTFKLYLVTLSLTILFFSFILPPNTSASTVWTHIDNSYSSLEEGVYNDIIWDDQYKRLQLQGKTLYEDFSFYDSIPDMSSQGWVWGDGSYEDGNSSSIKINGSDHSLNITRSKEYTSNIGAIRYFSRTRSGSVEFEVTPLSGATRVALNHKPYVNIGGVDSGQFMFRFQPSSNGGTEIRYGTNRGGGVMGEDSGVIPNAFEYGERQHVKMTWDLNGAKGVSVYLNGKLVVENFFQSMTTDDFYFYAVQLTAGEGGIPLKGTTGSADYHFVSLEQKFNISGSYTSKPIPINTTGTKVLSKSPLLSWGENKPSGTDIQVQSRVSKDGGTTWGSWSDESNNSSVNDLYAGDKVSNQTQIQYRVNMTSENNNVTPWLKNMIISAELNDLPDNLTLTGNVDSSHDFINLDWSKDATPDIRDYKIYQRKEGSSEFQTIGASNYTREVKVLNLYPDVTDTVTYTTWRGENKTLPKSASAEMWMESPTSDHLKGYGMGLVDVTPIDIDVFNINPDVYLKNLDGTWKYDVVYFGAWDGNRGKFPNDTAVAHLDQFLENGGGLLAGHDTIGFRWGADRGLSKLREYFNLKVGYWEDETLPTDDGFHYYTAVKGDKVKLSNKGLLNSFPWNLGDLGSLFNVPLSHSSAQFAFGDIWFTYEDAVQFKGPEVYAENINFYLTTWNNTAIIQTGHSNGEATEDEQKILANTLFYLAQMTNETTLKDYSGMDVSPPNKPIVSSSTNSSLTLGSTDDNGTEYEYYVEGTPKNISTPIKSNTLKLINKSGFKGYSVVFDKSPDTVPDNIVDTTNSTISLDETNRWVHISAVDNKGNLSEPVHYEYSSSPTADFKIISSPSDRLTPVLFKDNSTDPDNDIDYYNYDYRKQGDSEWVSMSTLKDPSHTFSEVGVFDVRLIVTDRTGYTDVIVKSVTIENLSPIANFSNKDSVNYEGNRISLQNTSTDPENDGLTAKWTVVYPNNTTQTFTSWNLDLTSASGGSHRVTLEVTDVHGARSTVTKTVSVTPLDIEGFVSHTTAWGSLSDYYENSNLEFYSGERFMLALAITDYPIDSITVNFSGKDVNNTVRTEITSLVYFKKDNGNQLYRGELFKDWMADPVARLKQGEAVFSFAVTFANGVVKTDVVTVSIIENAKKVYDLHRTN